MKPLNNKTEGCNPISSNCVIWQGPDIECIKLCKGDSVSDVVHKLATELCELMDMTSLTSYDLTCFNVPQCDPNNFQGLIQLLIDKICYLLDNQPSGSGNRVSGNGSDSIVSIAECFYYKTELGDTVTTMVVSDYARVIGNKVCDLSTQILSINQILANHEERITVLETTPLPVVVAPQVVPTCVGPAIATPMETVLSAVEQQFCQLRNATGLPTQLYNSISAECVNLSNQNALGVSGGIMATFPGWVISPSNVADSLTNMWITLCDLRSAVQYIKDTCCPSGCNGINITLTATFDGANLKLFFVGNIPAGFSDCDGVGNLFNIIDDGGNTVSQRVNVTTYMNAPLGYSINLAGSALNLASNFTIKTDACFVNPSTNTTCQFCIEYILDNTAVCPTLALTTTTDTSVNYAFSPFAIPATYTVQLWDSLGLAVLSQNITAVLAAGLQTGTFVGLTPSTNYRLRIIVSTGASTTDCPFVPFTTIPVVCTAPTAVGGLIELPTICPMCGPALGFVSSPAGDGYYIDDTSPYLLLRSGGSFNDIYTAAQVTSSTYSYAPALTTRRSNTTTLNGITFVTNCDPTGAAQSFIYVYDSSAVLLTTIALPWDPTPAVDTTITCTYITYSEFDDKVYFVSNTSTAGTTLKICSIDTSTFAVLYDIVPTIVIPQSVLLMSVSPVTGYAYMTNNLGNLYVVDLYADTILATLAEPNGFVRFNKSNGQAWVMRDNQLAINIYDGTTHTLVGSATSSAGHKARIGSANGNMFGITYYPGDGSPGSDRMFAVFQDIGNTTNYLIEFNANAPYADTIFLSVPFLSSPINVIYSYSFNKIFFNYANNFTAYSPTDNVTPYANVVIGTGNLCWPFEDTTNSQIVYHSYSTNPVANVYWIGLDITTAVECTQRIVNFYQPVVGNNEGPYAWNDTTLTWSSACTYTVNDLGASFSVVAIFPGINFQAAMLVYSVDNGLTWNNYGDFKTEAQWNAGVIYNKADVLPYTNFLLRIAFLTDNNCGLASRIDTTFN